MKHTNFQRGVGTAAIFGIVAVVLVIAAIGYYAIRPANAPQINPADNQSGSAAMDGGNGGMTDKGQMTDKSSDVEMMAQFSGRVLAGSVAPLLDFVRSDYDAALKTDKLIVLYFYANWCPTCREETTNALYPAFNELAAERVIGFRVNYNDNETDDAERALAREFGVAYQHTKVFVKNGERIIKSPEAWTKERYASEIARVVGE